MDQWYAQNSNSNIDSVNMWNSQSNGSGSFLTWPPGSDDILIANRKIGIVINTGFTTGEITTKGGVAGASGGRFVCGISTTINTNISADTQPCLQMSGSDWVLVVNGSITGGSVANAWGLSVQSISGSYILNLNGNCVGGSGSGADGLRLQNNTALGNVVINGDIIGTAANPPGAGGRGMHMIGSTPVLQDTLIVNGNIKSASGTIGLFNGPQGGGGVQYFKSIIINGNISGPIDSTTSASLNATSGSTLIINGDIYNNRGGGVSIGGDGGVVVINGNIYNLTAGSSTISSTVQTNAFMGDLTIVGSLIGSSGSATSISGRFKWAPRAGDYYEIRNASGSPIRLVPQRGPIRGIITGGRL